MYKHYTTSNLAGKVVDSTRIKQVFCASKMLKTIPTVDSEKCRYFQNPGSDRMRTKFSK